MSRINSTKRQDGREVDEIREISIAFNQLDRADGSAKFAFGTSRLHSIKLYFSPWKSCYLLLDHSDDQVPRAP
jgi:exosome complex RNA-binding protein Rrp42 (RNase PH superfamily)